MGERATTNKEIYEARLPDGTLCGQPGPRDYHRFADTLPHISRTAESLLDVGCGSGDWLHFVLQHRPLKTHLGVDVAENKIEEARRRFRHLQLQCGFAEQLDIPAESFDVVTCLELLEHLPEWLGVLQSLFRFARQQVLVTVPYREKIVQTVCIHCANVTPLYGHLRSYTEETFPAVPGWSRSFARLRDRDPARPLEWRIYCLFRPTYPWLLASYRRGM